MTIPAQTTEPRSLHDISMDITDHWPKIYYGAKPYVDAMLALDRMTDKYYEDDAKSIVRYFLVNARTWRGPDAKRVKAELNAMLKL